MVWVLDGWVGGWFGFWIGGWVVGWEGTYVPFLDVGDEGALESPHAEAVVVAVLVVGVALFLGGWVGGGVGGWEEMGWWVGGRG